MVSIRLESNITQSMKNMQKDLFTLNVHSYILLVFFLNFTCPIIANNVAVAQEVKKQLIKENTVAPINCIRTEIDTLTQTGVCYDCDYNKHYFSIIRGDILSPAKKTCPNDNRIILKQLILKGKTNSIDCIEITIDDTTQTGLCIDCENRLHKFSISNNTDKLKPVKLKCP